MPIKVELYVEDNFSQSSSGEDINLDTSETWEEWFQQWLEILSADLPPAPSYEIGLVLTDDNQIQELNAQYRQQNQPTDVLSFAALEADLPYNEEMQASLPLYLGDIIVSVDTAQRQAQQQEHNLLTELVWLTAHGLLHLLGWDHPDEESLIPMLKQQVVLLNAIGITMEID